MPIGNLDALLTRDEPQEFETELRARHMHIGPGVWDALCKTNNSVFMTSIWSSVTCKECLEKRGK